MVSFDFMDELSAALVECDFAVHTGSERKLASRVKVFPAAWISPLKVERVSGLREGVVMYKGCVKMMMQNPIEELDKLHLWSVMEQLWQQVADRLLSSERVAGLSTARCLPGEADLTGNDELSLSVEFGLSLYF